MNTQITVIRDFAWTPAALSWWRTYSNLFEPEQAAGVLEVAQQTAASRGSAVVSANDLQAAAIQAGVAV